jgi:hypothetical protein
MLQPSSTASVIARVLAAGAIAAAIIGVLPFQLVLPIVNEPNVQASEDLSQRDEIEFVFLHEGQTTMSGSTGDIERARRHRKGEEDLLWFREKGREYIVRDPAILSAVRNLWAPVAVIGEEQGEIGAKQGAIGARQAVIGAKQAEIGAHQASIGSRQAAIGARQAALAARQVRSSSDAERTEIDRSMRALDDDMRALDREMRALDARIREFDKPMEDLGKEMEVLGREMDALGAKIDEASSKAQAGMRSLVDKAIASGAAQLVR